MTVLLLAMLIPGSTKDYGEPLRPQFHFTARSGWLNDPNGLVFFRGEFHMFFQHNPFGRDWGNMTWGHAMSKDLLHWTQQPEAIAPDSLGTIFSGSAVVDKDNTTGFGTRSKPPLVCIYTAAGGTNEASKGKPFTQCLAYSLDGRTFTKFAGNPVLPHQVGENRDPKVLWYAPTKRWIMALYLEGSRYALFGSPNLRMWKKLSEVDMPGAGECPDFFQLPIDGIRKNSKWVFWTAPGLYRIGDFNGTTFTPETQCLRTNWGNTSYAAQTFFNDPKGRRVQIAWLNNSTFPGTAWNQQMGIPTELTLRTTPDGPRLAILPVEELNSLRLHRIPSSSAPSIPGSIPIGSKDGLLDIELDAPAKNIGSIHVNVGGVTVTYDSTRQELTALGRTAPLPSGTDRLQLRILIDRASIEIFAQGGLVYMPLFAISSPRNNHVTVESSSEVALRHLKAWEVGTIWDRQVSLN